MEPPETGGVSGRIRGSYKGSGWFEDASFPKIYLQIWNYTGEGRVPSLEEGTGRERFSNVGMTPCFVRNVIRAKPLASGITWGFNHVIAATVYFLLAVDQID